MKKLFSRKEDTRSRLVEFLDKKGFYIILVLCIVIIGSVAVFITTNSLTPSNKDLEGNIVADGDDTDVAQQEDGNEKLAAQSSTKTTNTPVEDKTAQKTDDQALQASANTGTAKDTKAPIDTKKPATTSSDKKPATAGKTTNTANTPLKFIAPVNGEITLDYAMDRLIYSKTLEEWRTHSGVDIGAARGTPVKAAAAGVVSEIKNDPRFGAIIIIDHKNGTKTMYANLASTDMVKVNKEVKQGDVIGSIGNTAMFETSEPAHLHFEVWKNDKEVNPNEYLPKK